MGGVSRSLLLLSCNKEKYSDHQDQSPHHVKKKKCRSFRLPTNRSAQGRGRKSNSCGFGLAEPMRTPSAGAAPRRPRSAGGTPTPTKTGAGGRIPRVRVSRGLDWRNSCTRKLKPEGWGVHIRGLDQAHQQSFANCLLKVPPDDAEISAR